MIARDLRFAVRMYRRTPVFSFVATAVLAVAVAVATAVFSLYSHLALQPVPGVQGADRMVSVGLARDANDWIPFSIAQFQLLAESLTVPEALVAASASRRPVEVDGEDAEAAVAGVTTGYMQALGVRMLLGADLDAASADPAATNAVISERFWHERFDGRPGAVGSIVVVDGQEFTVVGVAGGGFAGLRRGGLRDDVWIPIEAALRAAAPGMPGMPDEQRRQLTRTMPFMRVSARLPAGVGLERLQQELEVIWPRWRTAPDAGVTNPLMRLEALPGTAANPRGHLTLVRQSQLLVGGAVLVLLVASLNLASFFLARGPGRIAELRTRLAVGASRPALVRQLFVEAATLIALATALGILLHFWLRTLLLRLPPFVDVPAAQLQVQTDWRVLAFVVAAASVVTLTAGLLPAARVALTPRLAATAPSGIGRSGHRLQPLLVLQVAVATLVVLAGAVFVGELQRLERADTGFDPTGLLAGRFMFEPTAIRGALRMRGDPAQSTQFAAELTERVSALDGVDGIGIASALPFHSPPMNPGAVELVGVDDQPAEAQRRVYHNRTTPDFFRVFAPRFLHGRPYDGSDPLEVVVSRTLARQLWGRDDVVGERLTDADAGMAVGSRGGVTILMRQQGDEVPSADYTVIGVVDDMRYEGQGDAPPPMLYRPWTGPSLLGQSYFVRGSVDGATVHPVIDELVRERFAPLHAEAPVAVTAAMRDALGSERARGRLASAAALLALALTVVGLYASMQHMVEARRGELALRKAVGASDRTLVAMIMRRAGAIIAAGVALALAAAGVLGGRLSELMFGLDPLSVGAWTVALLVVGAISMAAAWFPAARAGRVDPATALKYE